MLLKKLELQGFKSFADKTQLDLSHKVTAIVGPNGSGKSNVADAARWLLGERDARNLRGGKGEDLIFAGSKDKPRAGLAQATLHFDNSSGALPVDFKDVVISRRVTRDGGSNFSINKSDVRLKDVIEFFAKAKLGARGLTIINQGESDLFIKASPLERREMIEEILGLKEYQIKKADSTRRLKNTNNNLEKATALIDELKPHLRLLRKQVSRYEGREEAEKELKALEDQFYGFNLKNLEKQISELSQEEGKISKELVKSQQELSELKQALSKVKESEPEASLKLKKLQEEEDKLQKQKADVQLELGKAQARLELAKDTGDLDIEKAKRAIEDVKKTALAVEQESNLEKLQGAISKIINLVKNLTGKDTNTDSIESDQKKYTQEIEKINKGIESIKNDQKELRETLENFNEKFTKSYEAVDAKQKIVSDLITRQNEVLVKKERLQARLDSLLEELEQIGRSKGSFSDSEVSKDERMSEHEIRQKMLKLRSQLASIGEIDESVVKEAKETEERYEFLTTQVEDLQKAIVDLESLIEELEKKIHNEFDSAIGQINKEFAKLMKLVFGGGKAKLKIQKPIKKSEDEEENGEEKKAGGVEIDIVLPKKRIKGLEVLSGGERALVSIAALFSLISVSPPSFIFLDEVDAALDERNAKRFGEIVKEFSGKTQFVIVTHNRATMEAADVLYGVTMSQDGVSKLVSLKLSN